MEKEELLKVLSNVNVNSETAYQAVELYVKFLYFEHFSNMAIVLGFLIFGGWICYLAFKND